MPFVQARNNHPGPLCLTHRGPGGEEQYKWEGCHDRINSVQEVPDYVVEGVNFRRIRDRGILTVVNDENNRSAQADLWNATQNADSQDVLSKLDKKSTANEFIEVNCIGPGARSGSACGVAIPVRNSEKDFRPPLCDIHAGLSDRFYLDEAGDKPVWKINR